MIPGSLGLEMWRPKHLSFHRITVHIQLHHLLYRHTIIALLDNHTILNDIIIAPIRLCFYRFQRQGSCFQLFRRQFYDARFELDHLHDQQF